MKKALLLSLTALFAISVASAQDVTKQNQTVPSNVSTADNEKLNTAPDPTVKDVKKQDINKTVNPAANAAVKLTEEEQKKQQELLEEQKKQQENVEKQKKQGTTITKKVSEEIERTEEPKKTANREIGKTEEPKKTANKEIGKTEEPKKATNKEIGKTEEPKKVTNKEIEKAEELKKTSDKEIEKITITVDSKKDTEQPQTTPKKGSQKIGKK